MTNIYDFAEMTIILTKDGAGITTLRKGPAPTTQEQFLAETLKVNNYLQEIREGIHSPLPN